MKVLAARSVRLRGVQAVLSAWPSRVGDQKTPRQAALINLPTVRVEADEIWSFCYAKQKNVPEDFRDTPGYGDIWTWVGIDADTKLVPSWLVGERTIEDCYAVLRDLKHRLLPDTRPQLTTDGHNLYPVAVEALWRNGIDDEVMQKQCGNAPADEARRYSPAVCTGIDIRVITGNPDADKISTSYVERQNFTMRMGCVASLD